MKPISKNTAYPVLRKDAPKKDGTHPIILRVKINGRKKDISLFEYCPLLFWDRSRSLVKRSYPEAEKINQVISNKQLLAQSIIQRYKNNNTLLTLGEFENEFGYEKTASFIDFIEAEIKKELKILNKSEGTISGYYKDLSKLKRYKPTILFTDLTVSFLDGYETYMRNNLANKTNTIHRSLKFIRTFLNRGIAQGLTQKYPFRIKRLKLEPTKREYLIEAEINAITNVYNNLPDRANSKKILRAFLFCCYTGIRFTDAKNLRYKDINNNVLSIRMHKTNEIITVPLLDRAKDLLQLDSTVVATDLQNEQTIFKIPCNQVANRHLKSICTAAGVRKNLTFHCSRHTFATIALTKGIPIETVQKLLGHRELKDTSIYAKIIDTKLIQDMGMLNLAFNNADQQKSTTVLN